MKGSVTKRGSKWSVMIDLPRDPVIGKRRQRRITAPTRREVELLAVEALSKLESEGFPEAEASKMTVSQYMERWVESIYSTVRPTTQRRYADMVRLHISPYIGHIQVSKLSPFDVQRLYANRLASGLSPTTVNLLHGILHKALKQGIRLRFLTRNVTEAVDAPKEATPEYATWSQPEVGQFLAVSDADPLAALWRLALLTGMRRGEILGLKWEDVDLARGTLSVKRTVSRGTGGTFEFGQPKTPRSRRSLALPRSVVQSLQRHRIRQAEHRLRLGSAYADHGLVFADELGGPVHPNTLGYRFKGLIARAGVPRIRFHDLRHTSATLMLANGEHPKIVQERLGHADISMTLNRYSHVTMDMQRDAADRLDALVART
jgi:integrase